MTTTHDAQRAMKIFFKSELDEHDRKEWFAITGQYDLTTKVLWDTIRASESVFHRDGIVSVTTFGVRDKGKWLDYNNTTDDYPNEIRKITHWQPLPAAPGSVPQAEPPNIPWSDWAHKHMTALRNAIFATIPEEEKNANMGDEALVAWPAELLKRLNVAAGAAQPGDDKPGEK